MVKSPKLGAGDLHIFHLTSFKFTSFNYSSKTSVRKVFRRKHFLLKKKTCSINKFQPKHIDCTKDLPETSPESHTPPRASTQLQYIKINKFIESQRLESPSKIISPTIDPALPMPPLTTSPGTISVLVWGLKWHIPPPSLADAALYSD